MLGISPQGVAGSAYGTVLATFIEMAIPMCVFYEGSILVGKGDAVFTDEQSGRALQVFGRDPVEEPLDRLPRIGHAASGSISTG